MENTPTSSAPIRPDVGNSSYFDPNSEPPINPFDWNHIWERIVRLGLGEVTLRIGTGLASLILILLVSWVLGNFYLTGQMPVSELSAQAAAPTAIPLVEAPEYAGVVVNGVTRHAELHTILPSRPRFQIIQYEVQTGDTLFGIAAMFNLQPETMLWGNVAILGDDPHRLRPGQLLNILPLDGVLHEWSAGEGLNGVAEYYGIAPEVIIDWPGNNLTLESVGDFSAPNIESGTLLFVPGGTRDFVTWSAPRITRDNPAVASQLGPGSCGVVTDGAVGTGSFIWPTVSQVVSGYEYSPETNHYAIDLGGQTGDNILASDNGVVVYAGWNDWGYGYMVVIDHGGWQTLYAHLSEYYVACAQSIYQGEVLGAMGSTGNSSGPHLHFEMRSDEYGRVNPHQFLP